LLTGAFLMDASATSPSVIHIAIELSATSWVIAYRLPRIDKVRLLRLEAGDSEALLALVSDLRERVAAQGGGETIAASCFEAGRDGFWLHRLLTAHGVISHVVEPTSILVSRGARRAKTDRLDAQGLLRVLAAAFAGDRDICRMVRAPTVAEEDGKRPHREREYLVQERVRIENRMAALLATQGVPKRPSLRSWEANLEALRTGDGRPLPPCLKAELDRLRRRLLLTLEMIREVEAEREHAIAADNSPANETVKALRKLRGIGDNFAAVLAKEIFYRTFDNRRQIAAYLGLAPTPFQSGGMDRDRRINRAGNSRARKTMVQLAWLWLRYQPDSALAQWFRERVGDLQGRTRRIAIIAMARKLLIAIWRFASSGIVPEGAIVAA
jgi:transposase